MEGWAACWAGKTQIRAFQLLLLGWDKTILLTGCQADTVPVLEWTDLHHIGVPSHNEPELLSWHLYELLGEDFLLKRRSPFNQAMLIMLQMAEHSLSQLKHRDVYWEHPEASHIQAWKGQRLRQLCVPRSWSPLASTFILPSMCLCLHPSLWLSQFKFPTPKRRHLNGSLCEPPLVTLVFKKNCNRIYWGYIGW